MFATSMSVHAAGQPKRKSVFADDKQAWPASFYKRPCLMHVGGDTAQMHDCGDVWGSATSARRRTRDAVEIPMAAARAVPMQRERAWHTAASDYAPRRIPPEPALMRKSPPPRWGDFEMSVGDEMQWWDDASDLACLASVNLGVPVRRVGPLVPRHKVDDSTRPLFP